MNRMAVRFLALAVVTCLGAAVGSAQPVAPKQLSYQNLVIANLEYAGGNLVKLAEAVPAEKYSWRPAPGVRSVSEVFMHVTLSNYFLLARMGVVTPQGLSRESEKTVTEKAQVVEWLKKSLDAVKQAVQSSSDADLAKPVRLFNADNSVQGVILQIVSHVHEHLGQSIAYARSNGVKPPWSE